MTVHYHRRKQCLGQIIRHGHPSDRSQPAFQRSADRRLAKPQQDAYVTEDHGRARQDVEHPILKEAVLHQPIVLIAVSNTKNRDQ